jgi:hypothetical protein
MHYNHDGDPTVQPQDGLTFAQAHSCPRLLLSAWLRAVLPCVQFVCLVRLIRWVWLYVALICIIIGAVLLAVGDYNKPKTEVVTPVYNGRTSIAYTTSSGDQTTYATYVAVGVIILVLGRC